MYLEELTDYKKQMNQITRLISDSHSKYILLSRIAIFEGFLYEKISEHPTYSPRPADKTSIEDKVKFFKNRYYLLHLVEKDLSTEIHYLISKLRLIRNRIAHGDFNLTANMPVCTFVEKFLNEVETLFLKAVPTEDRDQVPQAITDRISIFSLDKNDLKNLGNDLDKILGSL